MSTTDEKYLAELDSKALDIAKHAIELRNKLEFFSQRAAVQIAQETSKEFDLTMSEFSYAYSKAVRENYDELSLLSNTPLSTYFKIFAKNKHGNETTVAILQANGYTHAIETHVARHEPFFYDQEDCRAEVLMDLSELEKVKNAARQ